MVHFILPDETKQEVLLQQERQVNGHDGTIAIAKA